MEKSTASCYPKAAGGLMLVCFGVLLSNVGNLLYNWGAPLTASLSAVPGLLLLAAGVYRAGADEPGFYRALLCLALGLIVNQSRGYLGTQYLELSILHYHISVLLTMGALNLAFAAAGRLLLAAGRDKLAKLSGIVGKANILWYVLTIAGQLPVLENDLTFLVLYAATWPICGLILIFLFLAGRALRANGDNS